MIVVYTAYAECANLTIPLVNDNYTRCELTAKAFLPMFVFGQKYATSAQISIVSAARAVAKSMRVGTRFGLIGHAPGTSFV